MYPVRVVSFNNGWEKLKYEKPLEWQDLQKSLLEITYDILTAPENIPSYRTPQDPSLYDFPKILESNIKSKGWANIRRRSRNSKNSGFTIRNVRNGVAIRVLATESPSTHSISKLLFVDAPRAQGLGICDIYIVLVPTGDILLLYNRKRDSFSFTESKCRAQLTDLLSLPINSSFIIIFISTSFEEISTEDLTKIQQSLGVDSINRSIEFSPEYYQAGVGILSYFGEVLRKKHPNINAKVRIEQNGNTVRMHIESPSGDIEVIEKELNKYALVIAEQQPPESLFTNPVDVLALKNKLEITQLEVKQANDLLQLTRDLSNKNIFDLKQEVTALRQQMGTQLLQTNALIHLATQQVTSNERLQLAQITHSNTLFSDLLNEAQGNQSTLNAIRSLEHNLMSGIATIDIEDKISQSLTTIQQNKPNLLTRIANQLEGAGYGTLAGSVLEWIKLHSQ